VVKFKYPIQTNTSESASKMVKANRLMVHALAYNLFNWFRRVALSANMRK